VDPLIFWGSSTASKFTIYFGNAAIFTIF